MSAKSAPKQTGDKPLRSVAASANPQSPRRLGYARLSTGEQTTTTRLQLDALKQAACERIFRDKASGAQRSRPQLTRVLAALRAGDTLVVWKLDRLGFSLRNLLELTEKLRERGVALRLLTENLDTATAAGKTLHAVLGAVAQFERDVLRERTIAGIRAAQARGQHVGRPRALSVSQVREAHKMLERGKSATHVARIMRVGRSTLYRATAAGR